MRRIINRMIYDTEKAVPVTDNSGSVLYRTNNDNWFLVRGDHIRPLDVADAIEMLESWSEYEVLEKHFADHLTEA
jgi:hypothetical protein